MSSEAQIALNTFRTLISGHSFIVMHQGTEEVVLHKYVISHGIYSILAALSDLK